MTTLAPYKAACVQFEPALGRKADNIAALSRLVEEAAHAGARLVVTPEMGTTGYCWHDRDEVAPEVEPVPGPTTEHFTALARRLDCYLVIGLPEVDPATDLYYNSAVLIGPRGVIGCHRKSHSYISEPKWAAPGDAGHAVHETPIGRIAMLICMDIHYVETARLAALGGADVICHISNWLGERTPAPYWISRAVENGCYLVEANRWGLERTVQFSGGSCVIEPDGTIAAAVDRGDGIGYATIDPARVRRREVFGEPVWAQRRPELYKSLMTNTFLWNPADFFRLYGHRPLPPGRRSRVSVVQMAVGDGPAANLPRLEALALQARERDGAELVVFPELSVSGTVDPARHAEPVDGPSIARLQRFALVHRMHLVVGLAERDADGLYHSAVVVGPEGIVACHRQLHLPTVHQGWARPGQRWTVCDLPYGRLGLLLGHDAAFPEAGRALALAGCDLIACPSAQDSGFVGGHHGSAVGQNHPIPTGADPLHWHFYRTRAGENNVYLAFANAWRPGVSIGRSGVFGPDSFSFPRQEAVLLDGEGIATLTTDTTSAPGSVYPTNIVRRKDLVLMRLPHHYLPLVLGEPVATARTAAMRPAEAPAPAALTA